MGKVSVGDRFARSWRFIGAIIIPIILLPLIFIRDDDRIKDGASDKKSTKFKMAYAMLLMTFYWALELAPLPITALLPLLLFPLLGVQDIYAVSENYSKESNMIFLTGVIVAISLEYCNLHRRIALRVMTLVGGTPTRLLGATMAITSFLAMWLSSTTCAVLVLPTVVALIDEVNDSPVIMTKSEARRKSQAPSALYYSGAETNAGGDPDRKLSTYSSFNGDRRRSTMFENAALVGPRRGSTSPAPWNTFYPARQSLSIGQPMNSTVEGQSRSNTATPRGSLATSSNPSPMPFRSKRVSILIHQSRNADNQPPPYAPRTSEINANSREGSISPSARIILSTNLNNQLEEEDQTEKEFMAQEKTKAKIKTMFLLGIMCAANIGGTAVITGAAPNKVFKEIIKPLHFDQNGKYRNMTFFLWFAMQVPPMIVNVIIAWLYLSATYQGISSLKRWLNRNSKDDATIYKWKAQEVQIYLSKEYEKLGGISYHEVAVGIIFILVIVAWILRDPVIFNGWGSLYTGAKSGDSTGAMFGVILLFIIPKNWAFLFRDSKESIYEPLLDWKFVASKLPWAVLLLLGSGFALADASDKSGLSEWIGQELKSLGELSLPILLLIVILGTSMITEVVSNVACANIILPIMISISKALEIHPLYVTVPAAVACSFAFMLPVASPTNALVFASGNFSSFQMAKTGIFLNIICISVLFLNTVTWGNFLFDYYNYDYPDTSNGTDPHDIHVMYS